MPGCPSSRDATCAVRRRCGIAATIAASYDICVSFGDPKLAGSAQSVWHERFDFPMREVRL